MAALPAVYPPIYPGDGTVVLLTADRTRTFVFPLVGEAPDHLAGFKLVADELRAQTAVMTADDKLLLAQVTPAPAPT